MQFQTARWRGPSQIVLVCLCLKVSITEQSGCIAKAFSAAWLPIVAVHPCVPVTVQHGNVTSLTWSLFQFPPPTRPLTMVQRFSPFSFPSFFLKIFISEKILLTFWIKFVRKDCPVIVPLEQVHRLLFADSMFGFLSLMLKPGLPNTA